MNPTPRDHIVKSYDNELHRLAGEIVTMGQQAVSQLEDAIIALLQRDPALAQSIDQRDDALDAKELEVDHDVARLLVLRQPAATDLRGIIAALRVSSDIERIGDYGVNIARRSLTLESSVPEMLMPGLTELAALATKAVRDVVRAWQGRDTALAQTIWDGDDAIDDAYVKFFSDVLQHMQDQPDDIAVCTQLLFVAKNLERTGDHVSNIAENIWFAAEGQQ